MKYFYFRVINQQLNTFDFIKEQFNGSAKDIYSIWLQLKSGYNYIHELYRLLNSINEEKYLFMIAFDEAQNLFSFDINENKDNYAVKKPSGIKDHTLTLYYAITKYIDSFNMVAIFSGTNFFLTNAYKGSSDLGKDSRLLIYYHFDTCKAPYDLIASTLDLGELTITNELKSQINKREGRWRYTFMIINFYATLLLNCSEITPKKKK